MIDLMTAGQNAVIAALQASTDPALGPVLENVKVNTTPPYNRVGDITSENDAGKGEQRERLTVEVHSVVQAFSRAPLLAMMHAVRNALDGVVLTAAGVAFSPVEFVTASAATPRLDATTYVGLSTFSFFAEPA